MNNKDLISVIVPIYKVEPYLDRCVRSIVNQTYKNMEIILVDDGSPDNCPAICDEWAKKDSRIKVIHKLNGGLSDARNAGLAVARGELISFVDSDDWIDINMLHTLFKVMQGKKADIVECGVKYIDEIGHTLRIRSCVSAVVELDKVGALKELVKETIVYQTVWNKLYKASVIKGIVFETGKLNEDDFWTYQVFDNLNKLVVINNPLYYYSQRTSSIMGTGYTIRRLDGLIARFQRMEYLQKYPETADFTKARILGDCMYHLQTALKYLSKEEQKLVCDYIKGKLKSIGKINFKDSEISIKYKLWYAFFTAFPLTTATLRNMIGIGY